MRNKIFNSLEIDAIGEIMNISLGSSATAVSNMLDHRVDITTPKVKVIDAEDFSFEKLEPAIGVEIKYVTGLEGSNIMLLKIRDVKTITDILFGMETPDEEFELNDLTLSAVCEVMNQMMGAASTALSDFLGRMVNISTPQTFDADDLEAIKRERLPCSTGPIVIISFSLDIEGAVRSEFMNVISVELAKEMVAGFGLSSDDDEEEEDETEPEAAAVTETTSGNSGGVMSQDEIEKLMAGTMGSAPAPQPAPASAGGVMSQDEIEKLMAGTMGSASAPQPEQPQQPPANAQIPPNMQQPSPMNQQMYPMGQQQTPPMNQQMPYANNMMGYYPPPYYNWVNPDGTPMYPPMMGYWPQPPEPKKEEPKKEEPKKPEPKIVHSKSHSMPVLDDGTELSEEQSQNLDLIMSVPLEVAVEIGRTRKKVQEILSMTKGSLVVLDKLAGDQVDVYVNGKCIAHGDVVVVDDNFGIRINEIVRKPGLEDLT